jgi:YegS/Rv2252/BmrU family lipid kinase
VRIAAVNARRLLVVRNPRARRTPTEHALLEAAAPLRAAGWRIEVQTTRGPGHATMLAAAAAASGVTVVAACGGDGTVHEVVNGLVGTDAALAVVPAGTANVWAREAHAPLDTAGALALIPRARWVRLDVGRVRVASGAERRFLLMCGIGLDAAAVLRVDTGSRAKRWLGRARYLSAAAGVLLHARAVEATIGIDGVTERMPLLEVLVGNTRLYGGVTQLTAGAFANDGVLDVCTFSGRGLVQRLSLGARALRGGLDRRAGGGITYRRGAQIEVTTLDSARALPVQADGEYVGDTPVRVSVEPGALLALIAPGRNVLLREG